ncbi:hypothetical protein PsorP6_014792 [Peronosclerospora sorghi]|uniref:Uncharacterized protein n=1 Tax=Peronosclerospora sorghi TaxID=230839 RepID=A0ACC0VSR0_9STRA|nr:hypothetical protein PsorP6_014792 [Peronosclerospora sorghi]
MHYVIGFIGRSPYRVPVTWRSQFIWVTIANGQRMESKGHGSVRFVLDGERTHRAVHQVGETVVDTVPKAGKLFEWRVGRAAREEANVAAGDTSVDTSVALWHARLGHVLGTKMKMVASACDVVPEFGNAAAHEPALCNEGALGKMTTSPFSHTSGSGVTTQTPFELVTSWDPSSQSLRVSQSTL